MGTERYITGVGQALVVHAAGLCAGEHCVVHNPSTHAMLEFPTLWRGDRALMERICPHGVGHPDPDHIAFVASTKGKEAARTELVHGCDGCCGGCYYDL